ncbi:hypothetical protein O181_108676 [Austropuccinia psidii MF-1]|uniref:Uncharacterized protein n=1 Tax=Austropuccinia psidii MF-1 TaxID=1389203 RepID=A0A9Q3JVR7_9BASI|nr:hypothetical protein [Austropuccinia psidii MF-1]
MSSNSPEYSSTFLKAIEPFTIEEFEEMVFGTPTTPIRQSMWEWVTSMTPPPTCPPSPPSLASLSVSSSQASSLEEEPLSLALTFYTFINGDYDPHLFVDYPETFFAIQPTSNPQVSEQPAGHTYALQPRGRDGRAITFRSKQ